MANQMNEKHPEPRKPIGKSMANTYHTNPTPIRECKKCEFSVVGTKPRGNAI